MSSVAEALTKYGTVTYHILCFTVVDGSCVSDACVVETFTFSNVMALHVCDSDTNNAYFKSVPMFPMHAI